MSRMYSIDEFKMRVLQMRFGDQNELLSIKRGTQESQALVRYEVDLNHNGKLLYVFFIFGEDEDCLEGVVGKINKECESFSVLSNHPFGDEHRKYLDRILLDKYSLSMNKLINLKGTHYFRNRFSQYIESISVKHDSFLPDICNDCLENLLEDFYCFFNE